MKMLKTLTLSLLLAAATPPLVSAADRNLEGHPGYVDFSVLTAIANVEPTVEISLKEPLLNMVTNLIRAEDEQAADFISKLLRVTVHVFESADIDVAEVADSMANIADELDDRGWDRVVRVRENINHVDVYFRLSDDATVIHGIAIMVAEPGETVLVNIVGDISDDDIAALGRRFYIDELAEYHPDLD